MVHELKCWPEYFQAVWNGDKQFEVRKNDRGYKVGDTLRLREWMPEHQRIEQHEGDGYTGYEIEARVTYILDNLQFVKDGFVVMGIQIMWVDKPRGQHLLEG